MNRLFRTTGVLTIVASALAGAAPSYDAAATAAWRTTREAELRSPTGWLTVAGLYFLKPGANSIGSDPASDVVLPGSAPAVAGTIDYASSGEVTLRLGNGIAARLHNQPASGAVVLLGAEGTERRQPPRVSIGDVSLQVHRSGSRLGIRLRDPKSDLLRSFSGLRWYPVDPDWSVRARFIPYDTPKTFSTQNVLGDNTESIGRGEVEFTVNGTTTRLVAFGEGRRLSFVFSDGTSGRDTYRIRFLSADAADSDGYVTLDFNRAYNPPCAFNPYTTCPVPIAQNRLKVAITAGEKAYHARTPQTSARQE